MKGIVGQDGLGFSAKLSWTLLGHAAPGIIA